jgi:hypothetical protein
MHVPTMAAVAAATDTEDMDTQDSHTTDMDTTRTTDSLRMGAGSEGRTDVPFSSAIEAIRTKRPGVGRVFYFFAVDPTHTSPASGAGGLPDNWHSLPMLLAPASQHVGNGFKADVTGNGLSDENPTRSHAPFVAKV